MWSTMLAKDTHCNERQMSDRPEKSQTDIKQMTQTSPDNQKSACLTDTDVRQIDRKRQMPDRQTDTDVRQCQTDRCHIDRDSCQTNRERWM